MSDPPAGIAVISSAPSTPEPEPEPELRQQQVAGETTEPQPDPACGPVRGLLAYLDVHPSQQSVHDRESANLSRKTPHTIHNARRASPSPTLKSCGFQLFEKAQGLPSAPPATRAGDHQAVTEHLLRTILELYDFVSVSVSVSLCRSRSLSVSVVTLMLYGAGTDAPWRILSRACSRTQQISRSVPPQSICIASRLPPPPLCVYVLHTYWPSYVGR